MKDHILETGIIEMGRKYAFSLIMVDVKMAMSVHTSILTYNYANMKKDVITKVPLVLFFTK